jgi:hypothetical protein
MERVPEDDGSGTDLRITFSKSFSSVEEVNEALNRDTDTLFRVQSEFQKKFRWFYTYLSYSETILQTDRFRNIDQRQYFTPEEYEFIERLPARGSKISQADSIFTENLNEKIFDEYTVEGAVAEHFNFMEERFREYGFPESTVKTLEDRREELVRILIDSEDDDAFSALDEELLFVDLIDSLIVELPRPEIDEAYLEFNNSFEKRLNYMSWVSDGTFTNQIKMPWSVVHSNADSIEGNTLIWKPLTMKFLLTDYKMEAESRRMNTWAVIVSLLILLFTIFLFVRRK